MAREPVDAVGRWSSEELLLRAAWFYYKDELTQDEIAKRLSVSRASVGSTEASNGGLARFGRINGSHLVLIGFGLVGPMRARPL